MTIDLRAVTISNIQSGVPHGTELLAYADTIVGSDPTALTQARLALLSAMGPRALVQAAAIAANFSMNDRAANATGITLESIFVRDSAEFRRELGIDGFPSARNTLKRN